MGSFKFFENKTLFELVITVLLVILAQQRNLYKYKYILYKYKGAVLKIRARVHHRNLLFPTVGYTVNETDTNFYSIMNCRLGSIPQSY